MAIPLGISYDPNSASYTALGNYPSLAVQDAAMAAASGAAGPSSSSQPRAGPSSAGTPGLRTATLLNHQRVQAMIPRQLSTWLAASAM